jgi:5'-nucleotidase
MAFTTLLDRRPDLVVSGINAGMNVGNSIYYSGTVAGAVEGVLFNVPAVAISMQTFGRKEPLWDTGCRVAESVLHWVLRHPLPNRLLLNVNIPNLPFEDLRGIRTTCQGTSLFVDDYDEQRHDDGRRIFKNIGEKLVTSPEPGDADDLLILEGYVSITPLRLDMTDQSWRDLVAEEIDLLQHEAGLGPPPDRRRTPQDDPTAALPKE